MNHILFNYYLIIILLFNYNIYIFYSLFLIYLLNKIIYEFFGHTPNSVYANFPTN